MIRLCLERDMGAENSNHVEHWRYINGNAFFFVDFIDIYLLAAKIFSYTFFPYSFIKWLLCFCNQKQFLLFDVHGGASTQISTVCSSEALVIFNFIIH